MGRITGNRATAALGVGSGWIGAVRRLVCLTIVLAVAITACAPRLAPSGPGGEGAPTLSEHILVTGDGLELPLRRWSEYGETPKGVILALHGFNDYSMAFNEVGNWFALQGYTFYAYDQRGFGASPHSGLWHGSHRMTSDLATAVSLLRQRYPEQPVYLLGTSMGGAVILAGIRHGNLPEVEGLVLVGPAVWARRAMPIYQRVALWLTVRTLPWLTLTGSGLGVQASDNIDALRQLGRDPLVIKGTRVDAVHGLTDLMSEALDAGPAVHMPTLILYGEKDQIVPARPTMSLWQSLPSDDRIVPALYEEGWHLLLRDLQAYNVWRDIEAWIEDPAAPLPSGADARAARALEHGDIPPPEPGQTDE